MEIKLVLLIIAEIIFCLFLAWAVTHVNDFVHFEKTIARQIREYRQKRKKAKREKLISVISEELTRAGLTVVPISVSGGEKRRSFNPDELVGYLSKDGGGS